MKRYAIVAEKAKANYSAYVPDLPGSVATGAPVRETERCLRRAIEVRLQGLREDGLPIPKPSSRVQYLEVVARRARRHPLRLPLRMVATSEKISQKR